MVNKYNLETTQRSVGVPENRDCPHFSCPHFCCPHFCSYSKFCTQFSITFVFMEGNQISTFKLTASLKQSIDRKIKFNEPLSYEVDNIKATITNHKDDESKLSIALDIDTTDTERARFIAEGELLRIANILSWEKSIPITNPRILSIENSHTEGNTNIVVMTATYTIDTYVSLQVSLNSESVRLLSEKFNDGNQVPEDIQLMWREAISEPSKSLQFLLYFRILEKVKDNDKSVDAYIRFLQPDIELRKDGHGKKEVSLYKFLRDNIHAKNPSFPYQEIENCLTRLSDLVRNAVEAKYSSNLSVEE